MGTQFGTESTETISSDSSTHAGLIGGDRLAIVWVFSGLKCQPAGCQCADSSVPTAPCRLLRAGCSVPAAPCRLLRAGCSVPATPCRLPGNRWRLMPVTAGGCSSQPATAASAALRPTVKKEDRERQERAGESRTEQSRVEPPDDPAASLIG